MYIRYEIPNLSSVWLGVFLTGFIESVSSVLNREFLCTNDDLIFLLYNHNPDRIVEQEVQ